MIYKNADDRSNDLEQLQALLEVAPTPREQRVIRDALEDTRAGLRGEASVAHHLNRAYRSSQSVAIFHDIRISRDGDVTQIDHLILDNRNHSACVIETKNYSGTLACDDVGDWFVKYGKSVFPRESPVRQSRRHALTIEHWFKEYAPEWMSRAHYIVAIPAKGAIDRANMPVDSIILREDAIEEWWEAQFNTHKDSSSVVVSMARGAQSLSEDHAFRDIITNLLSHHVPDEIDWHSRLKIAPRAPGVSEPSEDALMAAHELLLYMRGSPSKFEKPEQGIRFLKADRGQRGVVLYLAGGSFRFRTTEHGDCELNAGGSPTLSAFMRRCAQESASYNEKEDVWRVLASRSQRVLAILLEQSAIEKALRADPDGTGTPILVSYTMVAEAPFADKEYAPSKP